MVGRLDVWMVSGLCGQMVGRLCGWMIGGQ